MSTAQDMIWCKDCERRTLHVQQKPNHLLHFLLTLITVGLWLIPWSWVWVFAGPPKCTECGKAVRLWQVKR